MVPDTPFTKLKPAGSLPETSDCTLISGVTNFAVTSTILRTASFVILPDFGSLNEYLTVYLPGCDNASSSSTEFPEELIIS